ncbi:MAG TPA: hypothetical protein QF804_06875 [Rhodospirillales bacterium]|nr:hypothetical protein [Rhodospirillales bacterium]
MGRPAMTPEWHYVSRRFDRFIEDLIPTETESRAAQVAAAEVAACLRAHFRPLDNLLAGGFPDVGESDYIVTGGHGKGTAVRPATVVDMLYVFPSASHARLKDARAPTADWMADQLVHAVGARFAAVAARGDGWITVTTDEVLAEGGPGRDLAVNVLPCLSKSGSAEGRRFGYPTCDADGLATWRTIDPGAEYNRLRAADEAGDGKATHLILMLKAWRRARDVPLASFAIELLVTEFVATWNYQRRGLLFYDWMVRDFFFWLCHQDGRALAVPGTNDHLVGLGDAWLGAARSAFAAARRACDAERRNASDAALGDWRGIFGESFPAPGELWNLPEARAPVRLASLAS